MSSRAGQSIASGGATDGGNARAEALFALGRFLRAQDYRFVTVTPGTHRRVQTRFERAGVRAARDLREAFGWNLAFATELLPAELIQQLTAADVLKDAGTGHRSRVRFSSLGGGLYAHSSFPTIETDAVFFGPDTYRFCGLLQRWAPAAQRLLDVGCGSGAGALSLADRAGELVLGDINPRALEYAGVNARLQGRGVTILHSDVAAGVRGEFDLIVANPPYMRDEAGRVYRNGGGEHGEGVSVRIVRECLPRLAAGGTLIVYTGSAFVGGVDTFRQAVTPLLSNAGAVDYEELDPDVFGDELERSAYADVERIAAVGLRVRV